ncbi:MAG TPA: PhoH family protein [Bacteroidia bacterium]|nr:PhoH family protein [Bacteroidia bacterium]
MKEIIIPVELSDSVSFFGANDANLQLIRDKFPHLKIISRGNEIKVLGDDSSVEYFHKKINLLIDQYEKKGVLEKSDVDELLNGTTVHVETPNNTELPDVLVFGPNGVMVKARTANQKKMVEASGRNDIVFAVGPAGTGKTYTAVALAVRALKSKEVRRIILTRPAVEAGENLGFLPGDLKEKIDPYLRPLYDALYDMIPGEKLKTLVETGVIEVAPLAFMRGRTLDNAFVILDEAQNATESQIKMFLTRMGPSAKFILTGDVTQIDLPAKQPSGLVQALSLLNGIKGVQMIYLDSSDVVRHPLVREIIKAYNKD